MLMHSALSTTSSFWTEELHLRARQRAHEYGPAMRAWAVIAITVALLGALAGPVGAQTGGGSDAIPVTPTVRSMIPELDQIALTSIGAVIANPDAPYEPLNTTTGLGPDGAAG